jgi:serine/threonine protein kinase
LGNSLVNVITHYEKISLDTVLVLGIQMIKRIQSLHEKCLLHRDIKPSNFVFGNENDNNKLFLIDLGFSKRYDYHGKHIEKKNIKNIIGTLNFVSLNIHNYIEPSRRDDIESCIYIILTMLLGNLDWFNETNVHKVFLLKQNIIETNKVPEFIKNILRYVRTIEFDEAPNYDYIIDVLKGEFLKNVL